MDSDLQLVHLEAGASGNLFSVIHFYEWPGKCHWKKWHTGKKYFENPIYEIKKQNQQKSKFIIVNILFLITISTFKTKPNSEKIEI